ncbi:MAG: hypothetical protein GWN01_09790, partial [Nitrosopumilaceae archaeon]|nr:hypothetical protein [Nitrosopumilaceae archaeon]NIU85957.1 hypothetical protein [Nitrosopumilaceae archaeon]NIV66024.1 hypothetical protein [Nitrosopumilaceae archaeon]NIX61798.1 hypothetical protein [Nitrosopumilaceae archaeon]
AIDRLQVSYDAFKELSEQGLIGARGIAGLREQFIRTGIPLEKFAKIIGKSSEDLAFFSGSALQGGK